MDSLDRGESALMRRRKHESSFPFEEAGMAGVQVMGSRRQAANLDWSQLVLNPHREKLGFHSPCRATGSL